MADVLIVGAGLFGLTLAERLASAGRSVEVWEARSHIGGNTYSEVDPDTGIEVHRYGAHIFHTSNERVWDYATRFTSFTDYRHQVWALRKGQLHPLPFGLATLSSLLGRYVSPGDADELLGRVPCDDPRDFESKALALIGRPLYEAFVRDYTAKQWATPVSELPPSIISRLPFRLTYGTDYFTDRWQGMPTRGYTAWAEDMASHPLIQIRKGIKVTRAMLPESIPVVWSGPLDGLMDYSQGELGWRTVNFNLTTLNTQDYQGTSVINYADAEEPATRCIEFRHFHPERPGQSDCQTIIATEFSRQARRGDEPYYPIATARDRRLVQAYREQVAEEAENVILGGRLGGYKYLDMHMAIASALTLADRLLAGVLGCVNSVV